MILASMARETSFQSARSRGFKNLTRPVGNLDFVLSRIILSANRICCPSRRGRKDSHHACDRKTITSRSSKPYFTVTIAWIEQLLTLAWSYHHVFGHVPCQSDKESERTTV